MTKTNERFSQPQTKCEDTLYGELLVAKLKKLKYEQRIRAKHDIDNVMFKYMSTSISTTYQPNQRDTIHQESTSPM